MFFMIKKRFLIVLVYNLQVQWSPLKNGGYSVATTNPPPALRDLTAIFFIIAEIL